MDKIDICSSCRHPTKYFCYHGPSNLYDFQIDGEKILGQMFENEIYKYFRMKEDDIELMGLNKENFHPKNLMLVLPVHLFLDHM